jgi:tetratricopeptide (TPR) repeat protein
MPTVDQKLYELVERSLAAGNMQHAVAACRELNTQFPNNFDGWRIAGEVHLAMQKADALLFSTERALALRPQDPTILLQRVEAFLGADNLSEARQLLLQLAGIDFGNAALHDRAGRHMASLDLHDESRQQYERAAALEPGNAALHYNLATAQRFTGQIDGAIASLDKALALDPRDFEAQAMRSSLKTHTPDSNHLVELTSLLDDPDLPERGKVSVCYALAKEYDDLDDIDNSSKYLQRGAVTRRRRMDYNVESDLGVVEKLKSIYSQEFFSRNHSGHDSVEPIFVIGLPRTGTTLVERILGSHSSVHAAGELDTFGRVMVRLVEESSAAKPTDRLELIERCSTLDMDELGRAYVDDARLLTDGSPRFIDKLPFNYLYAGLIHTALPKARIVSLERHPMASGYAMYKQLFRDPYPFSYDLDDLAKYYIAYRELMEHWNLVLPGVIHTIKYEKVIEDTEGESRCLLDHCGLDWEDQCLRFYENSQASTTASAAQVRQPVYRRSLDRWKLYREFLAPFERRLNDAGIGTE